MTNAIGAGEEGGQLRSNGHRLQNESSVRGPNMSRDERDEWPVILRRKYRSRRDEGTRTSNMLFRTV